MRQSGEGGSIINLSSIQALRPAAELAAYSASKAAVRALTKSVALHAARDRIRCNSVHPGGVHTRMLDDFAALTGDARSEEHTSELQSLMRISYAVFCLKKKHTHH